MWWRWSVFIQSVRFSASIRSSRVGVGSGQRVEKCRCAERVGTFPPGSFDGVFRVALTSHKPRIDGPTPCTSRVDRGCDLSHFNVCVYSMEMYVDTKARRFTGGKILHFRVFTFVCVYSILNVSIRRFTGGKTRVILNFRVCTFVCVYSIRECVDPTVHTLDGCRPGAFG